MTIYHFYMKIVNTIIIDIGCPSNFIVYIEVTASDGATLVDVLGPSLYNEYSCLMLLVRARHAMCYNYSSVLHHINTNSKI